MAHAVQHLVNFYHHLIRRDIYIRQRDVFFPEQVRAGRLFQLRDHLREADNDLENNNIFFVQEILCLKENKVC